MGMKRHLKLIDCMIKLKKTLKILKKNQLSLLEQLVQKVVSMIR